MKSLISRCRESRRHLSHFHSHTSFPAHLNSNTQGRRDGSTKDEPFAWNSREFLRKLSIGKPCVFRVDYALEAAGSKEFGSVFINDKDNLAVEVVAAGWAKIRPAGGQASPYYDVLAAAQSAAEGKGLGVWTKDGVAAAAAIRTLVASDQFDAAGYVGTVGKGHTVDAVVEQVLSGSMVRVTLLPALTSATVMIAGIQCPSLSSGGGGKRSNIAAAATSPATTPPAPTPNEPEPLAREAKFFTEVRCLNRDIKLTVQGTSQFGMLVGIVSVPPPSSVPPPPAAAGVVEEDLATTLLKAGLAKTAEWSLNMMTTGAFKLREAERSARTSRLGIWRSYVPPPSSSVKSSDKFSGLMVEVVSGDVLVIKDNATNEERRVTLSSIRAPRMGGREKAPDAWATEAKEFLRQRLIGKPVSVSLEYSRKMGGVGSIGQDGKPVTATSAAATGGDEKVMKFGTVTVQETHDKTGEAKSNNIAELLLVRGLAQVVKHRAEEERSAHYEDLMTAEEQGKKSKKGMWSSKDAPIPRVNDVSQPGSAARAKQHLSFLQRADKVTGVVEHVLSGHRVKVHIPKQGVTVLFSPAGVRCPQRGGGNAGITEEPYGTEAFMFTRHNVLQRDVELVVDTIDKSGTFLGVLRIPGQRNMNLGVALLENGLAKLHPSFEPSRVPGGKELADAQEKARKTKLKVWERDDEEEESSQQNGKSGNGVSDQQINGNTTIAPSSSSSPSRRELVKITVTDVSDANSFYVQVANEPRVSWLAEQLVKMKLDDTATATTSLLKAGDLCLAKFAADGQWYRSKVEKAHTADPTAPQYDVLFIDFGNRETVKGGSVRPISPELAAVGPQAHAAGLAFIKAPSLDVEYGVEAAQYLSEMVGDGRVLAAYVESKEVVGEGGDGSAPPPAKKASWGAAASGGGAKAKSQQLRWVLTLFITSDIGDDDEGDEKNAVDDDDDDDNNDSIAKDAKAEKKEDLYENTVNSKLLSYGLARVVVPPRTKESAALIAYKKAEEDARKRHAGIWQYGDPGDEDEDDDGGFPSLGQKKR